MKHNFFICRALKIDSLNFCYICLLCMSPAGHSSSLRQNFPQGSSFSMLKSRVAEKNVGLCPSCVAVFALSGKIEFSLLSVPAQPREERDWTTGLLGAFPPLLCVRQTQYSRFQL